MTLKPTPGPSNGKYEAPHFLNGASSRSPRPTAPAQKRTVFPNEPTHGDWRRPAYILDQFLFFGAPLRRYIVFLLIALGVMWALSGMPGRWWVAALFIALTVAVSVYLRRCRQQNFVRFHALPAPDPVPTRLVAADKIPVYVTGYFSVEGKYKYFSHLPGFYRTFPSGEHALLCLIRDRKILGIGQWPEEDIGMWYIFFSPDLIQSVAWGELAFGPDTAPALAVTYRLTIPPNDQNNKERVVDETVYIATAQDATEEDNAPEDSTGNRDVTNENAQRILADLLWQLPPTAQPKSMPRTNFSPKVTD